MSQIEKYEQNTTIFYLYVFSIVDRRKLDEWSRAVTQGAVAQGAVTHGRLTQGAVTQGAVTQGSVTQGAATQGPVTQGAVTQDAVTQRACHYLSSTRCYLGFRDYSIIITEIISKKNDNSSSLRPGSGV